MEPIKLVTDQLETPLTDHRTYRVVRLRNELEILLVHDPTADEAGACLAVDVGSMSDEIPGTAHALEHLLLRGSKKYPGENNFNAYIASHAGYKNASTSATTTSYYFEVAGLPGNGEEPAPDNPSALRGGLDRLAHLAIDPLVDPETVDRELRAVDSEYKMDMQMDRWRLLQLERSTANPEHPWNHFCLGNLKVLKEEPESRGVNIRDSLFDFFGEHYSANQMKLCILGREPISLLENWAVEFFSGIENKKLKPKLWSDAPPVMEGHLGIQYFVQPVMAFRELILIFPYLDETDLYREMPSDYIRHLLGHQSPGSFMAYLTDKGLVTQIYTGVSIVRDEGAAFFRCHIRLTPEGCRDYTKIANHFFSYISLIREAGPQKSIFDEVKLMDQLSFRFQEKTAVDAFTKLMVKRMRRPIPREWLLSAGYLRDFDPALITKALEHLRPDNLRLMVVSPEGTWDKTEKWFGARYSAEPIPAEFMSELARSVTSTAAARPAEFRLPRDNPFLPANTDIKQGRIARSGEKLLPEIIRNDERARIWRMDNSFGVPKAYVIALLRSPLLLGSAENTTKAYLLTELVEDRLLGSAYEAELSGLSYDVSSEARGLRVYVGGYHDKIAKLLELVMTTIRDLQIREDRFGIIKEKATDAYHNGDFLVPYKQTISCTEWLTTEKSVSLAEQAATLPGIDIESLREFKSKLLSRLHIELYAHGNLDRDDARNLTAIIESTLNPAVLPQADWPVTRSLIFPPGSKYRYEKTLADPAEVNNCVEYWIYTGTRIDVGVRARTTLLCQMMRKTAFDWLRTKLKLGYVVLTNNRPSYAARGMDIIVQGEKSCRYMERCIEAFLKTYASWLAKMTDEVLETDKRSLIARITRKPKNLYEEFDEYWGYVDGEYFNFETEEIVAVVEALSLSDMIEFYNDFINPASDRAARVVVNFKSQIVGAQADSNANKDTLVGEGGTSMSVESIRQHLVHSLNTDEAEVDDGVELWREICRPEAEANETETGQAIEIDDTHAFKNGLESIAPPPEDLSRFEQKS